MTEDTRLNADAVAWVQALQARGVTLKAHGKRGLAMVPKGAFAAMSNEERATLKAHKRDIVAIVREGKYAPAVVEPQAAKAPAAPCPHCYRSPCIGEQHPAYEALHPLTERQVFERQIEQTKKDLNEMKLRLHYNLPSPTWDL